MSVIQPPMFSNQLSSSFPAGQYKASRNNFENFFTSFKPRVGARKMRSVSPASLSSPETYTVSRKRRSHSDESNLYALGNVERNLSKRAKTAPSSPAPEPLSPIVLNRSIPDMEVATSPTVTLPSISDALASIDEDKTRHLKLPLPSVPTVSLDYFDTYKPNDANWRYGLWDSLRNSPSAFSLEKYAYLSKHVTSKKLPSIHEFETPGRPCFDSRVSSKAFSAVPHRKINFPYESNYTYLTKTYLNDVERFPEYLELAQSLVQLSNPEMNEGNERSEKPKPIYSHCTAHIHENNPHHSPLGSHFGSFNKNTNQYSNSRVAQSPPPATLPKMAQFSLHTPEKSHGFKPTSPPLSGNKEREQKYPSTQPTQTTQNTQTTRFIPITPPSVKDKSRSELMKSPSRSASALPRMCISCGSDQSPCWRPSWSTNEGQLCNSCGLRYKKTAARCLNSECRKVPAKGEWALMQSKGKTVFEDGERAHGCLSCGWKVEVKK